MGKTYDHIDDKLRELIAKQKIFFVATAPLSGDGLVNLSPKGLDGTFQVLSPTSVAYLDFVGSGVETIAHVRENGRMTIMFCAFEGPPKILRLYGRGRVVEKSDPEYPELAARFPDLPGARAVICLDCERITDACGFGVPLMSYEGDRSQLTAYAERKGPEGMREYQEKNNRQSLDGLPGLVGPIS